MNCVICLEPNDNKRKQSSPAIFKCYTCNDGFVCNNCIPNFDPCGSIFLDKLSQVKKTIKCPCCRTLNWNYHYNQIVGITIAEMDCLPENDACDLMIKNRYEKKCCGCGSDDIAVEGIGGREGVSMCRICWHDDIGDEEYEESGDDC
jgi:hypothetical protein|nr:MAG: hypothetical protein [Lake Baikal virophage 10]